MRLIFIRHGQTTGDVENRYGGAYDDELSTEGLAQCAQLAEELASKGLSKLYCSPLKRAKTTAEIVANAAKCPITIWPDLAERDQYGPLTGMTKTEALAKHPDLAELVKDRLNTLPRAESYEQMRVRIVRSLDKLAQEGPDGSAVVWHGGPMRALFRDYLQWGECIALATAAGWN